MARLERRATRLGNARRGGAVRTTASRGLVQFSVLAIGSADFAQAENLDLTPSPQTCSCPGRRSLAAFGDSGRQLYWFFPVKRICCPVGPLR